MNEVWKLYRNRWREVAEIERQELRQMSYQDRWRKLNWLRGLALALGLSETDEDKEVEIVRQRWRKLKNL